MIVEKKIAQTKLIIVKPNSTLQEIQNFVEKKKSGMFGTALTRPKSDTIDVVSVKLFFEPTWRIRGEYNIDYFRKNSYQISTDLHVKEVLIGSGTFPIITKSGVWKKFKDSVKIGEIKNKLDLPVEEHLEISRRAEIYLNSQGKDFELKHKISSKNIEKFPEEFIKANQIMMRSSDFTEKHVVESFLNFAKKDLGEYLRIVSESLEIFIVEKIFLPIYEARIVDSKNKIKILRIDGINSKIL